MQDYSIVDYDRLEKEMKGEKDVKAVWRRLLSLLKFFLNTVLVCFYLSVAVLAFFLVQHSITGETPSVFGHRMYIVGGDSMSPAFHNGSLIFVRPMEAQNIAAGDIITFQSAAGGEELITHRVVKVHTGENDLWFTTRGDANEVNDPVPVPAQDLIGRVQYHLPLIGHVISFAGTRTGLLSMIIIPAILLIMFELRSLFKISAQMKRRKEEARIKSMQVVLKEPGPEDDLPAQIETLPVKTKAIKKTNSRYAAGLVNEGTKSERKNYKNINCRECTGNYQGHNGHRATIIMFARKATAAAPNRGLGVQTDDATNRYYRPRNKVETRGRPKRYINSRTRTYVRPVSRFVPKSTEKSPS